MLGFYVFRMLKLSSSLEPKPTDLTAAQDQPRGNATMLRRRHAQALGTAPAAHSWAMPAAAQTAGPPAEIAIEARQAGGGDQSAGDRQDLCPAAPREGALPGCQGHARHQVRGGPERQALDGSSPNGRRQTAPGADFVHGGGFLARRPAHPSQPVLRQHRAVRRPHGMVGVNTTYRVAPSTPGRRAPEDVAAAVRWCGENIAGPRRRAGARVPDGPFGRRRPRRKPM